MSIPTDPLLLSVYTDAPRSIFDVLDEVDGEIAALALKIAELSITRQFDAWEAEVC